MMLADFQATSAAKKMTRAELKRILNDAPFEWRIRGKHDAVWYRVKGNAEMQDGGLACHYKVEPDGSPSADTQNAQRVLVLCLMMSDA